MATQLGVTNKLIEWSDPRQLPGSDFNPPARTENENLRPLIESMRLNGYYWYRPVILGSHGRVADGHRRTMAAIKAEIQMITVIRVKERDESELWEELNGFAKTLTGADYVWAAVHGLAREVLELSKNKAVASVLKAEAIGGAELLKKMAERHFGPGVVSEARNLARMVGRKGDKEFMARAAHWLIDWNAQYIVRAFIKSGNDPKIVEAAILANRSLVS